MAAGGIPILDLHALDETSLAAALREGFSAFGFVALRGHGIPQPHIDACFDGARRFFALASDAKRRYHTPGGGGARGYTPLGLETAKDAAVPDLKEFYHLGRELPAGATEGDYRAAGLLPNRWPSEVPELREVALTLYAALDALGARVLRATALALGQPRDHFASAIDRGNSVLRLLHYPALQDPPPQAVRAAAHEDINLITLLVSAREPGLQVLARNGSFIDAPAAEDLILCNVGDMLQRLTNHVLPSTTHRVINPEGAANVSRYAIPFFLHPNSDFLIETLPTCTGADHPNRYPEPVLADDYLQTRLRELGLQ